MRDAAALLLSFGALIAIAWCAARTLRLETIVGRVLAGYIASWLALVVVSGVLSVGHQLTRWTLVLALDAAALTLWLATRQERRRTARPRGRVSAAFINAAGDRLVLVFGAVMALCLTYVAGLGVLTYPNDWDGLTYHVTRAALWRQEHAIGFLEAGHEPRLNGNPPVSEIALHWLLSTTRTDRLLALPQYAALLACGLGVAGVARRLGSTTKEAAFGALAFLSLPVVLLQGQSILNDLVVASFLLAGVFFLISRERSAGTLGAVALGLALSTKFTAVFALPVVLVAVLALTKDRRRTQLGWLAVGVALGSPWYLINYVSEGSFDGGLGNSQRLEFGAWGVIHNVRAYLIDFIDASGGAGQGWLFSVAAGLALTLAIGFQLARVGRRPYPAVAVGVLVAILPIVTIAFGSFVMRGFQRSVRDVFGPDAAFATPHNWSVWVVADTTRSWYGTAGFLIVLAAPVIAWRAGKRGDTHPQAWIVALCPIWAVIVLGSALTWDPWRGRFVISAVGLAAAAAAACLTTRSLAWLVAGVAMATAPASLADAFTKPTGLPGVSDPPSVWGMQRIATQTLINPSSEHPINAVEARVPDNATLALVLPEDAFLSPYFGSRFSRTILLPTSVIPPTAGWALIHRFTVLECEQFSRIVASRARWSLLQRTRPGPCRFDSSALARDFEPRTKVSGIRGNDSSGQE